jgi:NADP-dependent aldehyde dehydrogenase
MTHHTELEQAAVQAEAAFDAYRATDAATRAAFLDSIADGIEALGDELTAVVTGETNLPAARAVSERGRTCGQLRMFARLLESDEWRGVRIAPGDPDRAPLPRPDLRLRRIPIGPVAVFGASNFPLAFSVAGGDTAAALAAGAPVIVKAHEAHPRTSALVAAAVQEAAVKHGLPEGVFAVLYGDGPGLGQALAAHPAVRAVAFTGSRRAGLAIAHTAAARPVPIPVFAEMSSVNPVFLMPAALAARPAELARGLVGSMALGAGQFCTSPGLVVVQEGDGLDAFLAEAAQAVAETPLHPMLTPGIHDAYIAGTARLASSVTTVARGEGDPAPVLFRTDAATFLAEPSLQDEVFGAASLVVTTGGEAETRDLVERLEGQLTATVHADAADHPEVGRLLPGLERLAGRIVFGGWPTGVEVGPATVHGGPYPATSDPRSTSVGTLAIDRFLRPVAYQDFPSELLPEETR